MVVRVVGVARISMAARVGKGGNESAKMTRVNKVARGRRGTK